MATKRPCTPRQVLAGGSMWLFDDTGKRTGSLTNGLACKDAVRLLGES